MYGVIPATVQLGFKVKFATKIIKKYEKCKRDKKILIKCHGENEKFRENGEVCFSKYDFSPKKFAKVKNFY